jgi:hypothetical protein
MANPQQVGSFIPTTNIWDVGEIYQATEDPKLQELLIRLYQNLNRMSLVVNIKESGFYPLQEFVTSNQYFPNPNNNSTTAAYASLRPVFRTVINFGALPNAAKKSVAHNIQFNSGFTVTRIYAAASDTTGLTYIPIPFVDVTGTNPVQLDVDQTNVNITTITNLTNYNICYVVVEYMKF